MQPRPTWELLCMGTSRSAITAIRAAIQNRHRTAGFRPPIHGSSEFSALTRCLAGLFGCPTALMFPVHRLLVAAMLRWRPTSARDNRDRPMVALATICCLRDAEFVALQICDLWFDFHTGYGIPGFRGTSAIHASRRKNGCERKGHQPAIGRARDPSSNILHQLKLWFQTRMHGLATSPFAPKLASPHTLACTAYPSSHDSGTARSACQSRPPRPSPTKCSPTPSSASWAHAGRPSATSPESRRAQADSPSPSPPTRRRRGHRGIPVPPERPQPDARRAQLHASSGSRTALRHLPGVWPASGPGSYGGSATEPGPLQQYSQTPLCHTPSAFGVTRHNNPRVQGFRTDHSGP